MTSSELSTGWHGMPLIHRMMVWCLMPIVVVAQFFGGSGRLLSPEVEVSDLPSRHDEELADSDFGEQFGQVLVGDRDDRVLTVLSELVRTRCTERIDVAIVHGASHVPGIVRGLRDRHGYRPRTAEWLTVLSA
jgi:hypothetical protein